jgi:hypothetical protein
MDNFVTEILSYIIFEPEVNFILGERLEKKSRHTKN